MSASNPGSVVRKTPGQEGEGDTHQELKDFLKQWLSTWAGIASSGSGGLVSVGKLFLGGPNLTLSSARSQELTQRERLLRCGRLWDGAQTPGSDSRAPSKAELGLRAGDRKGCAPQRRSGRPAPPGGSTRGRSRTRAEATEDLLLARDKVCVWLGL